MKWWFVTLGELRKNIYVFSNSTDYEIFDQDGMKFEKSFKSYLKN